MRVVIFFLCCILVGCSAMEEPSRSLPQQRLASQLVKDGTQALLAGELTRAEALYEQSLELEHNAEALDGLGCVELARKNFSRAENIFRKVNEYYPEYAMAYANLAFVHEQRGDLQGARRLYERALNLQPENVLARSNYAVFLHRHGLASPEFILREIEKAAALTDDEEVLHNRKVLSGGQR